MSIILFCFIILCFIFCLFVTVPKALIILFPVIIFYPRVLPQINFLGGIHGDDLMVLIIFFFLLIKTNFKKKSFPFSMWILSLLVIQQIGFVNGMLMGHLNLSFHEALKTELKEFRAFLFAFIIESCFDDKKELLRFYYSILFTFFCAFILMTIINLYPSFGLQYFWLRPHEILRYALQEKGTQRYAGVFSGVWNAGVVAEIVTVFSLSSVLGSTEKLRLSEKFLFLIPACSFIALVSSATRISSFVIIIGTLILIILNLRQAFKKIWTLIFWILVTFVLYSNISYVFESRVDKISQAFSDRAIIWKSIISASVPDCIFFGLGNNGLPQYSHNLYLWIFCATGLLGLIFFVVSIFTFLNSIKKMKKIENTLLYSSIGNFRQAITVTLICISIHGFTDSIGFYGREVLVIFFSLVYKWYGLSEIKSFRLVTYKNCAI